MQLLKKPQSRVTFRLLLLVKKKMTIKKLFPAGTTFATYAGLPLSLSGEICTAWDRGPGYGRPFDLALFRAKAEVCDEAHFRQAFEDWASLDKRKLAHRGILIVLPNSFPEGTQFADYEDVPVTALKYESTAWDRPGGREFPYESFFSKAAQCDETEFRRVVEKVNKEKREKEGAK